MNHYLKHIICLGAVALGAFLPIFGYAASTNNSPPAVRKSPIKVEQKQQAHKQAGTWNDQLAHLPSPTQRTIHGTDVHKKILQDYKSLKINPSSKVAGGQEAITDCCTCIPFGQADFGPAGDQTYIISAPGKYMMSEDVVFNGAIPGTPAIMIADGVNNVVLDLCSHTLSQTNGNPLIYGIFLGNYFSTGSLLGNTNITIRNGSIVTFTAAGIGGATFIPDTFSENLFFYDLNILQCGIPGFNSDGFQGIALFGGPPPHDHIPTYDNAPYQNIVIERCHVNNCIGGGFGGTGILIYTFDNLMIRDTQANNLVTPAQGGIGDGASTFGMAFAGRNTQIFSSQSDSCRLEEFVGPTFLSQVGGLDITSCVNFHCKNSQFNNHFGEAVAIVNNNLGVSFNVLFESVQFNNNQGGSASRLIYGVHGSGFPDLAYEGRGYKFVECEFNGASALGTSAQLGGIILQNVTDVTFDRCESRNITGAPDLLTGFWIASVDTDIIPEIADANNINFIKCITSDLTNTDGLTSIGFKVGGGNLAVTSGKQVIHYNAVFEDCIAERIHCSVSQADFDIFPLGAFACGIGDVDQTVPIVNPLVGSKNEAGETAKKFNTSVRGCRVSDVRGNIIETGKILPLSAGIIAESVSFPVIVQNIVSNCDRGILLTGTNFILPGPAGTNQVGLETGFQVALTKQDALAQPPVFITIDPSQAPNVPGAIFTNITRGNSITLSGSILVGLFGFDKSFLLTQSDLTKLCWQSGDKLLYNSNGNPDIAPLVNGQTYFAIVYSPGFAENGLIQDNSVTNCTVSGFQDDKTPCTSSLWLGNTAYCNGGANSDNNYSINWSGKKPITKGNLTCYPKVSKFANPNISVTCGKCNCKKPDRCNKKHHVNKKH